MRNNEEINIMNNSFPEILAPAGGGEQLTAALNAGADAVIVVPPYYFKLEPAQIEAYYDALAERIPGRL